MTVDATPGKVISFYSYKGGTGRSMALANIAWILASTGKKVLVIDWDLEAPGLHRYFHPFLVDKELTVSDGLIDFVTDFASAAVSASPRQAKRAKDWYLPHANILRYASSLRYDFPDPGTLDFVPAGRQGPDYATRVNRFDWQDFYERLGGGVFLEAARRLMLRYHYVLIDSRTGVSDTSGICTVHMPDVLVVCFTLNTQSIEGAAAVAESAHEQRIKPDGSPGLRIYPVPTRVERAETTRLGIARQIARERFAPLLWHLPPEQHDAYWGEVEVLYQPFYAYEEVLAVFGDEPNQTGSVLWSLQRLTQYVTGDVALAMPALEPATRQQYLQLFTRQPKPAAPVVPPPPPITPVAPADSVEVVPLRDVPVAPRPRVGHMSPWQYWLYFSAAHHDFGRELERLFDDLSTEIAAQLGTRARLGFWDRRLDLTQDFSAETDEATRTCRVAVCVFSPAFFASAHCGREYAMFRHRQAQAPFSPGILPIQWTPATELSVPDVAMHIQWQSTDRASTYPREGLRYLMRLKRHQDEYRAWISEFAERVVMVGRAQPLPVAAPDVSLRDMPNAFVSQGAAASPLHGPSGARFIYVPADSPIVPAARLHAQIVTAEARLLYREEPADHDLAISFGQAAARLDPVVAVIDPLRRDAVDAAARLFQAVANLGLVVLWTVRDPVAIDEWKSIEAALPPSVVVRHVWDAGTDSTEHLRAALIEVLSRLRARHVTGAPMPAARGAASPVEPQTRATP